MSVWVTHCHVAVRLALGEVAEPGGGLGWRGRAWAAFECCAGQFRDFESDPFSDQLELLASLVQRRDHGVEVRLKIIARERELALSVFGRVLLVPSDNPRGHQIRVERQVGLRDSGPSTEFPDLRSDVEQPARVTFHQPEEGFGLPPEDGGFAILFPLPLALETKGGKPPELLMVCAPLLERVTPCL